MSTNTTASRWWLALDGKPDGPRTTAYITAAVQTGTVSLTTPVCPEGDCRWQPLATWPELAEVARTAPPTNAPPPPVAQPFGNGAFDDRLVTNPLLPSMANLICIYTIVVAPLYWMFRLASTLLTGDVPVQDGTGPYLVFVLMDVLDTFVGLGLVVLGVIGGIGLRKLDRSSPRLLLIVFSSQFAWIVFLLIGTIVLLIYAAAHEALDDSEMSAGATAFSFFEIMVGLVLTAFEIVALIWLIKYRRNLPLR